MVSWWTPVISALGKVEDATHRIRRANDIDDSAVMVSITRITRALDSYWEAVSSENHSGDIIQSDPCYSTRGAQKNCTRLRRDSSMSVHGALLGACDPSEAFKCIRKFNVHSVERGPYLHTLSLAGHFLFLTSTCHCHSRHFDLLEARWKNLTLLHNFGHQICTKEPLPQLPRQFQRLASSTNKWSSIRVQGFVLSIMINSFVLSSLAVPSGEKVIG